MSCGGEIVGYKCNRLLAHKHYDGWRVGMVYNKGAGEKYAKRLWVTYSSLKTSGPAARTGQYLARERKCCDGCVAFPSRISCWRLYFLVFWGECLGLWEGA